MSTNRRTCRSCGSVELHRFLDLGELPLVNDLPACGAGPEVEDRYPLRVSLCRSCTLVQLDDDVAPSRMFNAAYPYHSSISDTLRTHSETHAAEAVATLGLDADSLVVEIGSNDGYLLRPFADRGVPVLGIDPSGGPVAAAREAKVPTVEAFFDEPLARQLRREGRRPDLVLANNVLAHVPEPSRLVAAMAQLVGDGGEVRIENPWVHDLIEGGQFDTIYQEHYSYLSCTAVADLAERNGMALVDVDHFPRLHGGTLRWTLAADRDPAPSVEHFFDIERRWGADRPSTYDGFARHVARVREALPALLGDLRRSGARIAGYGAAAKAAVLANCCGLTPELVEFVVDRDPGKQGRLMPGTRQPILAPEELDRRQVTHLLVFVWNLIDEIQEANQDFAERGGRFIVPIPRPEVLA